MQFAPAGGQLPISVKQQRHNSCQNPLHDRLQRHIEERCLQEACSVNNRVHWQIENQRQDSRNSGGMETIEPRAPHGDRVAGPRQSRTQEK